jgi:crossover junction endodeoxyribonuclease RusA
MRTYRLPVPPPQTAYFGLRAMKTTARRVIPVVFITPRGREFRDWVSEVVGKCDEPTLVGRLRVKVTIHHKANSKYDLDNRFKGLLDAATNAGIWGDDSQIDDLRIVRGEKRPPDGVCVLEVEEL